MSDVEMILAAFARGELLRPSADVTNIVDLSHAIASLAGVEGLSLTPNAGALMDAIGPSDHLVFALADGVGMCFVEGMERGAFIPSHLAAELRTVFPSTTPAALTSLATGLWPAQHALTGWDVYLPELGAVSTIIRFQRRSDEVDLSKLGIAPRQAYPVPSRIGGIKRDVLSLYPEKIVRTAYSGYWTGATAQYGYKKLRDAIDAIIRRVSRVGGWPTFTYLYMPHVDKVAHESGTGHARTQAKLRDVDRELGRLAKGLPRSARLVMTADHGLLDARLDQLHQIEPTDTLVAYLCKEPSGDRRLMYFDVREGATAEFVRRFKERFGGRFALISTEEAERLQLLGPARLSAATRSRLGNLMAVSMGADVINFRSGPDKPGPPKVSHHSGLSPAEMRVPLVVA